MLRKLGFLAGLDELPECSHGANDLLNAEFC